MTLCMHVNPGFTYESCNDYDQPNLRMVCMQAQAADMAKAEPKATRYAVKRLGRESTST